MTWLLFFIFLLTHIRPYTNRLFISLSIIFTWIGLGYESTRMLSASVFQLLLRLR